jgi:hypothetical protein
VQSLTVEYLEKENERLKKEVGKKSDSIWDMRKADLVQRAREVLGMSVQEAEAETVGQLRLLLKEHGESKLPKGLGRKTQGADGGMRRARSVNGGQRRPAGAEEPRADDPRHQDRGGGAVHGDRASHFYVGDDSHPGESGDEFFPEPGAGEEDHGRGWLRSCVARAASAAYATSRNLSGRARRSTALRCKTPGSS